LTKARNAFIIAIGILAVLWVIQIINNADHYQLSYDYSIQPRVAADLWHILTAPFLHWSWSHIEGNSIPLVVLGFLAAYRDIRTFIWVSVIVVLTSGLLTWLIASTNSDSAGASGVIFGWFGYVIVRGFFNHEMTDVIVGLAVMVYYLPIFTLLFPAPHLGYQDHIGGLLGGVFCGWAFRPRRRSEAQGPAMPSDEPIKPPARAVVVAPRQRVEDELAALKAEILDGTQNPEDRIGP
jgi:membrane associated rhomboid family serine protease